VTKQDTPDPTQDGIVLSQAPGGGTKALQGSTVSIVVGKFIGSPTPTPTPTKSPHGNAPMWLLAPWLLPVGLLPLWRLRRRRRPRLRGGR
jgi:beta-lactam-binding protein with PASTA domain